MATASKNARTASTTQKFFCPRGGEIAMQTIFENGKLKNVAKCLTCGHQERRPRDFDRCLSNGEES